MGGTFLQYPRQPTAENHGFFQPPDLSHEPVPVHGRLRTGGVDFPGPVNIIALSSGANHGLRASLAHVAGATLGFCLLLVLVGLGLHQLLLRWPLLGMLLHWGGVAFLLYMAWKLASDNGRLTNTHSTTAPSAWHGVAMQWLNPKAWLAAVAGVGAYTGVSSTCCGSLPGYMARSVLFRSRAGHGPGA